MRRGSSFIPTVRSAREWAYAFTGSCAVGRSRALPPIRELHPCPEDHHKVISSLLEEGPERREVTEADRKNAQVSNRFLQANKPRGLLRQQSVQQRRGGEDVFVRRDVVLRQSMENDDVGSMELLDLPHSAAAVMPMM